MFKDYLVELLECGCEPDTKYCIEGVDEPSVHFYLSEGNTIDCFAIKADLYTAVARLGRFTGSGTDPRSLAHTLKTVLGEGWFYSSPKGYYYLTDTHTLLFVYHDGWENSYSKVPVKAILATASNYVGGKGYPIGRDNTIPWKSKNDMRFFRETTKGNVVIMGHETFKSLDSKPLPKRFNIVLSRNAKALNKTLLDKYPNEELIFAETPEQALLYARACVDTFDYKGIMVMGGSIIYKLFVPYTHSVLWSTIGCKVEDADSFFELDPKFANTRTLHVWEADEENEYAVRVNWHYSPPPPKQG